MATSSSTNHLPPSKNATPASILLILRIEGLAAAAVTTLLYARTGASWWLFAALWLVPDLSMLGYLGGSCRGARIYNAVHSYVAPLVLALCAMCLPTHGLMPYALIWLNHISVDRLLGYGLKYADGFKWTHLSNPVVRGIISQSQGAPARPA